MDEIAKELLSTSTQLLCLILRGSGTVLHKAFKLTDKLLQAGIKKVMEQTGLSHGKQTLPQLMKDGAKLENINVKDADIKGFERIAKEYGLDYSIKKDIASTEPAYYVFFKSRDIEIMQLAFREYAHMKLPQEPDKAPEQEHTVQPGAEQAPENAPPEGTAPEKPISPEPSQIDLLAELKECKAEAAAQQAAEVAKGPMLSPEIPMEPSR